MSQGPSSGGTLPFGPSGTPLELARLPGGASDSVVPAAVERDDTEVLLAAPAPPRREKMLTILLMLLTAVAAAAMAISLRGEARYALGAGQPLEIGDLSTLAPSADLSNRYVRASGLLGTTGAIKYGRAAEGDSFRLAPIASNPKVWVEIRVPEGFEGPRFVPPSTFAGRLVPFRESGLRHAGLPDSVRGETKASIPDDAWVLIDGSSPRASRWALALAVLFAGFAAWNLVGIARLLSKVKDGDDPRADKPEAVTA